MIPTCAFSIEATNSPENISPTSRVYHHSFHSIATSSVPNRGAGGRLLFSHQNLSESVSEDVSKSTGRRVGVKNSRIRCSDKRKFCENEKIASIERILRSWMFQAKRSALNIRLHSKLHSVSKRKLFHLQFYFIHRSGENNIREGYINTVQRSKISESLAHYIVVRPIREFFLVPPVSEFSTWRKYFFRWRKIFNLQFFLLQKSDKKLTE